MIATTIEAYGDLTLKSGTNCTSIFNPVVYDDLQINISTIRLPASNAPTWTSYKGSEVLTFSGTNNNLIYFSAQLPHRYVTNQNIEFHIHYVPEDNTSGNVRWIFTYSWVNIGSAFPAETTTTTIVATPQVTDQHTAAVIDSAIVGSTPGISSILLCSLKRGGGHVNDTYEKNIYLISADFHFPIDTLGSRQTTIK